MQLRAIAFAAVFAASCATTAAPAPERVAFSLPGLDGKARTDAEFNGKVVLVDIWATWCKPCLAAMPVYARMVRDYGEKGFTVVAINVDEDADEVERFLDSRDFPFVILRDPAGSFPETMGVRKMPTSYLIGRDGSVQHVHEGFEAADEAELEQKILAALNTK